MSDLEEETALRERLAELLTQVATALKGPPAPLTSHDWSDLPAVAAKLVAERDALSKELFRIRTAPRSDPFALAEDDWNAGYESEPMPPQPSDWWGRGKALHQVEHWLELAEAENDALKAELASLRTK